MPVIGTEEDEGLDPQQGTHGPGTYVPPSGTPVASGGGEAGLAGGSGSGAGKTTQAPTSSGSHYTNLTDYLAANQGAGQTMGQAASGVVQGVGQQARGDLGSYQADAQKDASGATINVDPAVMSKINNGITQGASRTVTNKDGSKTTTTGAETYTGPEASATYAGPMDHAHVTGQTAQDQGQAYGDLARLAGYGQQASGGQSGNAALLKGLYTQPSYTAGENSFDAAVLGGTSGGQAGLSQIGQAAGAGETAGTQADAAVDKGFSDAARTTGATNQAYQDAINRMKSQAQAYKPTSTTISAPVTKEILKPAARKPIAAALTPTRRGSAGAAMISGGQPSNMGVAKAVSKAPQAAAKATSHSQPINVGQQVINTVTGAPGAVATNLKNGGGAAADAYHSVMHGFSDGGEVNNFAMPEDDKKESGGGLLEAAGKLAPLAMMLMKSGGQVPGKAMVPGDSSANDTVPAMLSAKEIVLPRSVTLSSDAPKKAAEFVQKVKGKKPTGYAALVELCKGGMP